MFFALLFSANLFANEGIKQNSAVDFCDAPKSSTQLTDSAFSGKQNNNSLRVLLLSKKNGCVISHTERQLLEEYSYINDLDLIWVYIENDWELLPALARFEADVIVGQDTNLSAQIQNQVRFTHAWSHASFKIVERTDNSRINRLEDLAGRQIVAYKSSPVWHELTELAKSQTGLSVKEIPEDLAFEEVMRRVKSAEYDLAVADSLLLDKYLPLNSELQSSFNLSEQRQMVWAVNNDNKDLHQSLNQYLNRQHLTHNIASIHLDDLSSIKDRGLLRVITNTNPSHYYLHEGKLLGFEYELLSQFAKRHQLRVDVVLARTKDEMFKLLREGKGDVIAASLPASLLTENNLFQYSLPYNFASPVVVGRNSEEQLVDLRDLSGRRITLSEDSPYWDYLMHLKSKGAEFDLVRAEAGINMEAALKMVALGMYDLTVVGNHQLAANKFATPALKAQFNLSEPQAHRWAVRLEDQQLFSALNNFVSGEFRGTKYNVTHAKYFEQPQIKKLGKDRFTRFTSLSPYDEMTQQYSEEYGFDWRLISALMFQESQFNPNASSYAGAEGLMQLIPSTAELMGVSDVNNPEMSINAGIRYLNYLRDKFEDAVLLQDRMWFAIASYNAGYGRVKRARALAEEMGLDKNVWFKNVEIAMLGLAKPYYKDGEQVRYCRCGQTVVYVREIRTRYFNYIRLVETQQLAISRARKDLNYINTLN